LNNANILGNNSGTVNLTGDTGSYSTRPTAPVNLINSFVFGATCRIVGKGNSLSSDGVYIDINSRVEPSGSESVFINGTGRKDVATDTAGVGIAGIVETDGGDIEIVGTGGGNSDPGALGNTGIFVTGTVQAIGAGMVSLYGSGGTGTLSRGFYLPT